MSEQPLPSSLNHFSIFAFTDDFWRLTSDDRTGMLSDWSAGLADAAGAVHFYQTYPLERHGDLIVWTAIPTPTPEAPAAFFEALARVTNPHRRYVRLHDVLWGLTRPSQYSKARSAQEIDPFQLDRHLYLIMYPFTKPEPGEWHSPWYAYKLEPTKEVVRKVLRYHKADPEKRLDFITTEMINLPDYGHNAKFSLIAQNAAIAQFVRDTWAEIGGDE